MRAPRRKITFLMRNLETGGVERAFITLAYQLASDRCDVTLVLFAAEGQLIADIPPEVRVLDLGETASVRGKPVRLARVINGLRHHLTTSRPDLVISAKEQCNLSALIARSLIRSSTTKIAISRHEPVASPLGESSMMIRFLYRTLYRQADAIVSVSDGIAREIRTLLPRQFHSRVHTIYNPVIGPRFHKQAHEEPADWPHDASEVFVGVGRLSAEKGFDMLIDAFSRVATPARRLVLVGDGPERRALELRAELLGVKPLIRFVGTARNALPYIRKADCIVVPSRYEGFGMVLVEALALRRPIIATDCPVGPREILADGRLGALVPPDNPEALAAAMSTYASSGRASASDVDCERYSSAAVGASYLRLMRSLTPAAQWPS